MAPLLSPVNFLSSIHHPIHEHLAARSLNFVLELERQWINPSDILSLLLLCGPDVLRLALAQLVGQGLTPVAFSFGWVAYSISNLLAVIGDQRLMPQSDFRATVVGAKSGHARNNKSWVLGRVLRDYELQAKPHTQSKDSPDWEALRVSVFKIMPGSKAGRPALDWVWYSGFVIILIQLSIAVVPLCLYGDWVVMVITICGTVLAFSHGALPQWGKEKWECPKKGAGTVTVTQGNGSRHAMVILGGPDTPDLEILAYSDGNTTCTFMTRAVSAVQLALWLALVITVAGIKQGAWYLLAIGAIGMLQNIFVAGCSRRLEAFGIHAELVDTVSDNKVSKVLAKIEEQYPLVGSSLLPVFYPAGFRPPVEQKKFWKVAGHRRQAVISDISAELIDEASLLSETHSQVREPTRTDPGTLESRMRARLQQDKRLHEAMQTKSHSEGTLGAGPTKH